MSRTFYIVACLLLASCSATGKSLRQGDDAFASGDYATALKHYEAAAAKQPDSAEAAEKLQRTRQKIAAQLAAVFAEGELPGLDRAGPTSLPTMAAYAPGKPVFTSLVLLDRIRGTTFEEPIRRIVVGLPDVRMMLDGTGVDPVRDFDSLFVASARPTMMNQTFLVVRPVLDQQTLRTRLDRRFNPPLEWTDDGSGLTRRLLPAAAPIEDARVLALRPGPLALVVQPAELEQLTAELPDESPLLAGVDVSPLVQRPSKLHAVAHVHRAATDPSTILLASTTARMMFGGFAFESARMRLSDIDRPRVDVDLELQSAGDAQTLASRCPAIKERVLGNMNFLVRGLVRVAIGPLRCQASGEFVTVSGEYTPEVMLRMLALIPAMLPPTPAPPVRR